MTFPFPSQDKFQPDKINWAKLFWNRYRFSRENCFDTQGQKIHTTSGLKFFTVGATRVSSSGMVDPTHAMLNS